MKLFSFVAIVVCAGIAQVLAVPLLVLPKDNRVVAIRLGHAIPNQPKGVGMGRKMRGPCRANRFNQKAVEVSNLFRQALGLPLIKPGSPDDDKVKIMPFIGTPPTFVSIGNKDIEGGNTDEHSRPHHAHAHGHHGHHRHLHHFGKGSFINRIHYSLMNLGRWEGRAVAFVLGCGIGVLLRMVFVLALVMYRAARGQRAEDQHEYSQITIIEEIVDTPKSAPPSYTYPVDEKFPILVETVNAPSTTEESK